MHTLKFRRRLQTVVLQVLAIVLFLFTWEEAVNLKLVSSLFLTAPTELPKYLMEALKSPSVVERILTTFEFAILAFALVVVTGTGLGLLIGSSFYLRSTLTLYLVLLSSAPLIVFIPLFWGVFGLGLKYQISYAFVSGIIPVLLNVTYGVKNIDPKLMRLAKTLGLSSMQRYAKVFLPSIVPSVLGGSRIAFTGVFAGVLVSEMYVGQSGIGYLVQHYAGLLLTPQLFAIIVITSLLVTVVNVVLIIIEGRLTVWNKSTNQL